MGAAVRYDVLREIAHSAWATGCSVHRGLWQRRLGGHGRVYDGLGHGQDVRRVRLTERHVGRGHPGTKGCLCSRGWRGFGGLSARRGRWSLPGHDHCFRGFADCHHMGLCGQCRQRESGVHIQRPILDHPLNRESGRHVFAIIGKSRPWRIASASRRCAMPWPRISRWIPQRSCTSRSQREASSGAH